MTVMPAKPQPAAMSAEELKALMDAHGLTNKQLADLLGVHRNTVSRWLTAAPKGTPIDAANALLIKTAIKDRKK